MFGQKMGSSMLQMVCPLEGAALKTVGAHQYSVFSSALVFRFSSRGPNGSQQTWPRTTLRPNCTGLWNGEKQVETARSPSKSEKGGKLEADFGLWALGDNVEEERAGGGRPGDKENLPSSSESPFLLFSIAPMAIYPFIAEGLGHSQASYCTALGLLVLSVPGIWSLVKRSTQSKIVEKAFAIAAPNIPEVNLPSEIAGELTSSLSRNNFAIDRGETVTFEGTVVPRRGHATFLSFCAAVSLGCVALVLSITALSLGENWYYLTVLSPLAGFCYWTRASRKEQSKGRMVLPDDKLSTDVIIQGGDKLGGGTGDANGGFDPLEIGAEPGNENEGILQTSDRIVPSGQASGSQQSKETEELVAGEDPSLPSMEDIVATAAEEGIKLQVKSFGPTFQILVTSLDETVLLGKADCWIKWWWPKGKIVHLESVKLERGISKQVGNVFGAGIFVGASTLRYGLDQGCRTAELLAIYDDEVTHAKLVKYYKRLGFKSLYEVNEEELKYFPDRVVWGGVGTRMDADCEELLRKWSVVLKPKAKSRSRTKGFSSPSDVVE